MSLDDLIVGPGFWYLATPYTHFAGGHDAAFKAACRVSGTLLAKGVTVFSPIAHSHPVALYGGLIHEALNLDFWLEHDFAMIDVSRGVLVALLPGHEKSRGVAAEIQHCRKLGKPYYFLHPETLEVT